MNRQLSERLHFPHVPAFWGTIEWAFDKGTIVLGIMQELIENHGDGHTYMLERVTNFIERIKAGDLETLRPEALSGTLVEPTGFDALPEELQVLLGARTAEQMHLL